MGKKVIRLTENELANLVIKGIIGTDPSKYLDNILNLAIPKKDKEEMLKDVNLSDLPDDVYNDFMNKLGKKGYNLPEPSKKQQNQYSPEDKKLDLNDSNQYKAYVSIANRFISSRPHNLLGITGKMLADGAKMAYNKHGVYVPPELALAQLAQEGGFSGNKNSRPIKTKNPFNVGNVDSGSNVFHNSVQSGIDRYYDLIAGRYLGGGKSSEDLYRNFVNRAGNRYATDRNYESKIRSIANGIKSISEPIYASLGLNDQNVV